MDTNFEETSVSTQNTQNKNVEVEQIKVYTRRWFMLILVLGYSLANTCQDYQYSSIAHIISNYYNVSYSAVNWTSLIPMIISLLFSIPGYYVINRVGIRKAVLLGITGTALGAWIKVFAVHPDRFWVVLLGQTVNSISHVLVSPVPTKLAASWFGESEVSTACSLALIGIGVGSMSGYVIPAFLVPSGPYDSYEGNLLLNVLIVAVFSTVMLPIIFFGFQEKPPLPPSIAQLKIRNKPNIVFSKAFKSLFTNKSFILFLLISGVNIGTFAFNKVMGSQIILYYYPNLEYHVGIIAIVNTLAATTGILIGGILTDKLKKFKQLTLGFYTCYMLSMIVFAMGLSRGIIVLYVVNCVLSLFFGSVSLISYQLCIELTYPQPEEIIGGFIASIYNMFCFIISYLYSIVHYSAANFWANILICTLLLLIDLLFLVLKFNLRRQTAQYSK